MLWLASVDPRCALVEHLLLDGLTPLTSETFDSLDNWLNPFPELKQ